MAISLVYCQKGDTFRPIKQTMATTSDILYFAQIRKRFSRKELIEYLKQEAKLGSTSSLSEPLYRLQKSGQLVRLERGLYAITDDKRTNFSMAISKEIQLLHQQLKSHFPNVDMCIWSKSTLVSYMHHIPSVTQLLVEVESDAVESVFNFLNSNSPNLVFLEPTVTDFERYIQSNETIVVTSLVSESPLQLVDGIKTPTIEKLLVDIVGDVVFSFLQGSEINNVYTTIFERHNVNKNKLLRYAARRGRKEEVEQLINANKL